MDGRRLSFEELGIYNGVFVMRDRQTGTLWSHFTGEAFEGPLKGRRLAWVPLQRAKFARARETWPSATMPVRSLMRFRPTPPMTERAKAMGEQLPGPFVPTLPEETGLARLPRHTHGVGVAVRAEHRFYPLHGLYEHEVVNDRIAGIDVVVMLQDGAAAASAYASCVDSLPLTFRRAGLPDGGVALADVQTGSVWTPQGRAVSGPLAGRQLTPVRTMVTDWYGWGAYFPKSSIFDATAP